MIISHKHKFIFLKSTKTAGSSIEVALAKFIGPDDVLTPDEEELRNSLGYPVSQNWQLPLEEHHFFHRLKIHLGKTQPLFYNHVRAFEIKPYIDPEHWNNYYKFVVARNPWDRVMSQYFFHFRKGIEPDLKKFICRKKLRRINKRGWGLYTINDKVVVDRICRYENLETEMEEVRQAIGLPERIDLPRAKSSFRKDKPGYREMLDDRQRNMIAREFRKEIDLLGYTF